MLIRDLRTCVEFVGGDGTLLRELLHPAKQPLKVNYSLAHASLPPDTVSLAHRLRSSEVYYILEGQGTMFINDEQGEVLLGQAVYIPPGATQRIRSTGPGELKFLCIV